MPDYRRGVSDAGEDGRVLLSGFNPCLCNESALITILFLIN
jgi:hypothetical protein